MAYIRNIPQSGDQLDVSQGQILNNFAAIGDWVEVNHVEFNTGDQGKHDLVEFFRNTAFTNVVPNANNQEIILGADLDPNTQKVELVLKRNSTEYSIFTSKLSNADVTTNILNQVRLTSGILLRFDTIRISVNAPGRRTLGFASSQGYIPFTNVFNVLITNVAANGTDCNVKLVSFTNTSVTVYITSRTTFNGNPGFAGFSILIIGV